MPKPWVLSPYRLNNLVVVMGKPNINKPVTTKKRPKTNLCHVPQIWVLQISFGAQVIKVAGIKASGPLGSG